MSLTKKYKFILSGLMTILSFLVVAQVALAVAPGVIKAQGGLDNTAETGGFKVGATETDLPTIIGKVVGAVLAFVGVAFFCLILWSGFGWMLAKGNEEEITKAKDTIFGAVLGLMVVLGAYAITYLMSMIFSNALTGK